MNDAVKLIGGIGLGAGLMYILDPDRGERRRSLIRDKAVKAYNSTGDAIGKTTRDLSNRASGLVAEAESIFIRDEAEISDKTLEARVRSKLGRCCSHPRAITVTADRGTIRLEGPVLSDEAEAIISAIEGVPGVRQLENQLEVHTLPDIPALQNGRTRQGERFELLQRNWSPAARLLVGAAGSALAIYGAQRRDLLGATLGTVGLGLITRGVTNANLMNPGEGDGQNITGGQGNQGQ